MSKAQIYDDAYKYLFSNKQIFLQFITSFVTEEFVKEITPEGKKYVNNNC